METMNLADCLSIAPYAALLRVARYYGVAIGHDCHRAHLLARLSATPMPRLIRAEACRSDGDALAALWALAEAGGYLERATFERGFGPCVVPRTGLIPPHPPAAWLAARGLLVAGKDMVVLPDEVRSALPPLDRAHPAKLIHSALPPATADASPLFGLAMLVMTARRGHARIDRRTGLLSRRTVDRLLPHCGPAATPEGLRFLAGIALTARLLGATINGTLHPGLALDAWLACDESAQFHALWQGWQTLATMEQGRRRQSRRRAPCDACPYLRGALTHRLADCLTTPLPAMDTHGQAGQAAREIVLRPRGLALLWADLACAREQSCPACRGRFADDQGGDGSDGSDASHLLPVTETTVGPAVAWEMLAGPLTWLGVCTAHALPDGSIVVSVTARGQALLAGTPWPDTAPALCRYLDVTATPAGPAATLQLIVPPTLAPDALLRLSEIASPDSDSACWRVEPLLVERLILAGGAVEDVYASLERLTGRALSPAWREALEGLCRVRAAATVTPVLLLESPEPFSPAGPAFAATLQRTLSLRAAVVQPGRLSTLRRALARRGLSLVVHGGVDTLDLAGGDGGNGTYAGHAPADAPERRSRPGRVAQAVGLDLLRALDARGLPTPPLPPASLISMPDEDERTAVALWSARLLSRLDDLLEPDVPEAMPDAPDDEAARASGIPAGAFGPGAGARADHTDPDMHQARERAATLTHVIAAAINDGQMLRLRYVTADGRPAHWRLVDPLRLDYRGNHAYLRAYCHWRRAPRLFRLDRILACDPASAFPPDPT